MKDQVQLTSLFQKYLNNQCTLVEVEKLMYYFNSKSSELLQQLIVKEFESLELQQESYPALPDRVFQGVKLKIARAKPKPVIRKLFPRWVAAASIAMAVMIGGYFYYNHQKQATDSIAYLNDVGPGSNGATLTLANGQKILIKDALAGNIATQSGVKISKTADGQIIYEITGNGANHSEYNTLSTSRGEQTQVRLPDGTLVFLNAESSLKYPASFAKLEKREVALTGEGYFEVAKDKAHPFIVKTDRQMVEVLGTHFNINNYSIEPNVKTTLVEGSVKISALNKSKILKPNEQAVLSADGNIAISEADTQVAVAWKNNQFMFDSENIKVVMRMVERWYDVEVEYVGEITDEKFGGGVSRFDKVSKVLKSLESTGKVHFRIEGRKIYVSK